MENKVRSSNEQREFSMISPCEEMSDMFTYQEGDYCEVFTEQDLEDMGMRIIEL